MYFNEKKYKNCINRLKDLKTFIVLSYIIIFSCIGVGCGLALMEKFGNKWFIITSTSGLGFIIGLIIGALSTWRVEMKVQEAYWKLDMINEIKKQTSIASKNTPIAKTVVAIENNQTPNTSSIEKI